MKNITGIILIGMVVISFSLSALNWRDNRQQDHLIFKTIDEMETITKQITQIASQINANQEAIIIINEAIIQLLTNHKK